MHILQDYSHAHQIVLNYNTLLCLWKWIFSRKRLFLAAFRDIHHVLFVCVFLCTVIFYYIIILYIIICGRTIIERAVYSHNIIKWRSFRTRELQPYNCRLLSETLYPLKQYDYRDYIHNMNRSYKKYVFSVPSYTRPTSAIVSSNSQTIKFCFRPCTIFNKRRFYFRYNAQGNYMHITMLYETTKSYIVKFKRKILKSNTENSICPGTRIAALKMVTAAGSARTV